MNNEARLGVTSGVDREIDGRSIESVLMAIGPRFPELLEDLDTLLTEPPVDRESFMNHGDPYPWRPDFRLRHILVSHLRATRAEVVEVLGRMGPLPTIEEVCQRVGVAPIEYADLDD